MTRLTSSLLVGLLPALLLFACEADPTGYAVRDGYLTGADGARLYYRTLGDGRETIVVVHGGPGAGMDSILPSVEPLAESFTLVLYDQRGGGRSELPSDTDKLDAGFFVEDLEAVRRHFRIERMNVLAHSFGAVLVARYCEAHPERLARIVFHGATGPRRSEAARIQRAKAEVSPAIPGRLSERASELLQSLMEGTAADAVATCREYEAIGRELAVARGEEVHYQGTTCRAPPEAVRYYYRYTAQLTPRSFGDWDFTRGLEEVFAPLLVVYGEDDPVGVPAQREWAEAVPNGRLLLVPDAGKAALSDNPELTLAAVERFFRGD